MVAYKIVFNIRRQPDKPVLIDDIDGRHIEQVVIGFCEDGLGELQAATRTGKYIRMAEPRVVEDGVLVRLLSGTAGDNRQVFDVESAAKKFDLDVSDASMVEVRALVSWRGTGLGYAIMCVEHSANSAGDTVLFDPFRRYLREIAPDVVVRFEPVVEAEALDEFESLEKVEVKRYLEEGDSADRITREGDCVSYVISHKRGRPFNLNSIRAILKEKSKPAVLFGYSGTPFDTDQSKIFVTLKDKRKRTRTFDIYGDYGMKVMAELTPVGKKPLSDDEFVEECGDRCETIADRIGRMI